VPIPDGVSKVSLIGQLAGGAEEFVTSFWIAAAGTTQAAVDTMTGLIHDAVQFGMPDLKLLLSDDCAFTDVRVYSYPEGGPNATFQASRPITGGAGTYSIYQPLQLSLVATLETGILGRSFRGRMYIPATGVDPTGHNADAGARNSMLDGLNAMFVAINADENLGPVSVVSQTRNEHNPVTALSADNRLDIQRRRAQQVPGVTRVVQPLG